LQKELAVVEAFDTNVVVRLLVQDDEEQCRRAERAFRSSVAAGGVWLSTLVLVETCWVLRVAYRFDRNTTAAALRRLMTTDGVTLENAELCLQALTAFEIGPADFADYVILAGARIAGALPLRTFDERLLRADGAEEVL
jgi:predicted nucleic-acid-binding protein